MTFSLPNRFLGLGVLLASTLLMVLSGGEASAQVRVLLLPQDTVTAFATEAQNQALFDFEITARSQELGNATLEDLLQFDVVVVWTNNGLSDPQALTAGNALADYVDAGGGVVEMVFSQFSTSFDIEGRWRSENYSCVAATGANIYSGGTIGEIAQPNHPMLNNVQTVGTGSFRTGTTTMLPGAQLVASYTDGQVLAATREDKAGRVVWIGMYPGQPQQFQGNWQELIFQAIDYAAVGFRASAGGTYTIDEGTASVTLDASGSRGDIFAYNWDLDGDGEFDDADTVAVEFDTSLLDGPSELIVQVQVTDVNNEVSTAEGRIVVNNVPPVITSVPPEQASINNEYAYPYIIEDPAGDLDTPIFTLVEGPEGVVFDEEGVMRWTPGPEHFEQTINFHVQVDDGDEGLAEQSWSLFITAPDEDGDRIPDEDDNCPLVPNVDQLDNDMDSIGDLCDGDDDNDEVLDVNDNCRFFANPDQADNDGTEGGDACDDDDDNDFVPDVDDNCPFTTNPSQADRDGDGVGDACADDEDRDSIPDEDDNCPLIQNTDQLDTDGDGQGNACDLDDDDDGLSDEDEAIAMTDPLDPDTDDDRLRDGREATELGTDPLSADTDEDGVDDGDEVLDHGTNPLAPDSDEDGLNDGDEINTLGTDPLNPDSDSDGLEDGEEINVHLTDPNSFDSDNGSVGDGDEITNNTDPNNPIDDIPADPDPDAFNNGPEDPIGDPTPGTPETDESCACASLSGAPTNERGPHGLAFLLIGLLWLGRRRKR